MGSISTPSGSLLSELYHYAHVNGVWIPFEKSISPKISANFKVENELLPKKGHMIFFPPLPSTALDLLNVLFGEICDEGFRGN